MAISRNAKYQHWKRSNPQKLPEGFVKVGVVLTVKEAEILRGKAALTGDGTYSAAIRDRMGISQVPHGLMKAVEDMLKDDA